MRDASLTPAAHDAWYDTPRGRWIGDREFALLVRLFDAKPGDTMLDVGCGTGYFSRRFARESGLKVTGVDIDPDMLAVAAGKAPDIALAVSDAENLPFADASFDCVVAVASLCFVADETRAVGERVCVARRRVVLGLLNRHSPLRVRKYGAGSHAGRTLAYAARSACAARRRRAERNPRRDRASLPRKRPGRAPDRTSHSGCISGRLLPRRCRSGPHRSRGQILTSRS